MFEYENSPFHISVSMEVNVKSRPPLDVLVRLLYSPVESLVGADGFLVALGRLLHWPVGVQSRPVWEKYVKISFVKRMR